MKVLITGSNGLLGQKISDIFIKEKVDFLATGRGPSRNPKEGIVYLELDITGIDFSVIREFKPTVVINTAAMTNVDQCETEQEACLELNVRSVEKLVTVCNEIGAQFIHLSTDFIFDGTKSMYTETDEPKPLSFYGNSKLLAEKHIQSHSEKYSIIRTVLVYGIVADMSRTNYCALGKRCIRKEARNKSGK